MASANSSRLDHLDMSSSDGDLLAICELIKSTAGRDPAIIASLAARLAQSGANLPAQGGQAGDVASTGGAGSLSTLLGPLYLVSRGIRVPKLGIPGRPAGGVDSLAKIPGYRTSLTISEVQEILGACGYVHFMPTDMIAPLDKRLFELRQHHHYQDVPGLVVASLLSKKLAMGLTAFTIDVRVFPQGNFGAYWDVARENADLLRHTAALLGLNAVTILSDARFMQQPFVGRAESLWALQLVLLQQEDDDLKLHALRCKAMARACHPLDPPAARIRTLGEAFADNLAAQGGAVSAFNELVERTAASHVNVIRAGNSGYFNADAAAIRSVIVAAQADETETPAGFPDPLGLRLLKRQGEWVSAGEPTATVRARDDVWNRYANSLEALIGHMQPVPVAPDFEGRI